MAGGLRLAVSQSWQGRTTSDGSLRFSRLFCAFGANLYFFRNQMSDQETENQPQTDEEVSLPKG